MPRVVSYLDGLGLDYELIVGDSGSTDETGKIVRDLGLAHVRVVRDELPGKGRILTRCLSQAKGRYVGFLDADLEIPEDTLGTLLDRLHRGADAAVAVKDETVSRRPLHRRVISRSLKLVLWGLFRTGVSDHQAGCKLFRAAVLRQILPLVRSKGWMWDSEVLIYIHKRRGRIEQVPVVAVPTRPSRFGPANILLSVAELVGLRLRTLPLPRTFPRRGKPGSVVAPWVR